MSSTMSLSKKAANVRHPPAPQNLNLTHFPYLWLPQPPPFATSVGPLILSLNKILAHTSIRFHPPPHHSSSISWRKAAFEIYKFPDLDPTKISAKSSTNGNINIHTIEFLHFQLVQKTLLALKPISIPSSSQPNAP